MYVKQLHTLLECVVDIEVRQMIAVDVCEPHLGFIGLFLHLARPHEALRDYTTVMGEGRRATRSRPFPLPLVTVAQHVTYILHTTSGSTQSTPTLHTSSHNHVTLQLSQFIFPHFSPLAIQLEHTLPTLRDATTTQHSTIQYNRITEVVQCHEVCLEFVFVWSVDAAALGG